MNIVTKLILIGIAIISSNHLFSSEASLPLTDEQKKWLQCIVDYPLELVLKNPKLTTDITGIYHGNLSLQCNGINFQFQVRDQTLFDRALLYQAIWSQAELLQRAESLDVTPKQLQDFKTMVSILIINRAEIDTRRQWEQHSPHVLEQAATLASYAIQRNDLLERYRKKERDNYE
jgi:hypothetical protein